MAPTRRTLMRAIGAGSIGTAAVPLASSGAAAATIITIEGGGADIWSEVDAFHFYYESLEGDFDVTVRNTELERTDAFAKTGLMVRETLDDDAKNVMLRRTPDGAASLQWRPEAGTETLSTTSGGEDESDVDGGSVQADWLRLRRSGDTVEAYGSTDGSDWTRIAQLGPENVDLDSAAHVGIPVTSHNVGTLCTAQHRNLSGISPDTNRDIGDVEVAGSVSVEEGVPFVSTDSPSDVTASSATLSGELTDLGGAESAECYFEYREVPTESWTATESTTLAETDEFSVDLGGLTSRRYYEVRAVADTSDGDRATGSSVTLGTPSISDGEDDSDGPESASAFDPGDGFADPAPWLDNDTPVILITEPTRRQLEAAVGVDGPRVVVFETSGTIDLDAQRLTVTNDRLYLAGQTAPSPGITLVRGGIWLSADDCVVQHVRVRPGDAGQDTSWEPDAIQTGDGTANNVIDHCTGTWSVDENINAGYDTTDTTISNCLIAEPLNDATHSKGEHGYNSIIGDRAKRVTYVGNVLAFATDRNPRLKEGTETVIANNLVHRYEDGMWADPDTAHSIEGNVFQRPVSEQANVFGEGSVHADGNVLDWDADVPMIGDGITLLDERPLWPDELERIPTDRVETHNLRNAGARPADRSEHDERIVENVRTAGGAVVDSQDEVGGYPDLAEHSRSLRVPSSGTRAWLRSWAKRVEVS
ncbi:pectate lyase [Halorarum halophilum]|uniref:Pectate lyase n=1 Tax=Halorarum halophilum TaxID=2743090 RepID=A0A7D5GMV1_9EURY|nr:pectate lyase [Halobaculum halophilum]QLG28824.1 pectate lyase [Halobaculum halophilum]